MKRKVTLFLLVTTVITAMVGCARTTTNPTSEVITTENTTTEEITTEEITTEETTTEIEATEAPTAEPLPADDYRTYSEIEAYYTEAGATYDESDECCHYTGTYSGVTIEDVTIDPRKFYEARWSDTVKEINTLYFNYNTYAMNGKSLVKTDIVYGIFTSEEEFRKAYTKLHNMEFDTLSFLWEPTCHNPIFDEPHEYYILWDCNLNNFEIIIDETIIDEVSNLPQSEKEGWSRVCPPTYS